MTKVALFIPKGILLKDVATVSCCFMHDY